MAQRCRFRNSRRCLRVPAKGYNIRGCRPIGGRISLSLKSVRSLSSFEQRILAPLASAKDKICESFDRIFFRAICWFDAVSWSAEIFRSCPPWSYRRMRSITALFFRISLKYCPAPETASIPCLLRIQERNKLSPGSCRVASTGNESASTIAITHIFFTHLLKTKESFCFRQEKFSVGVRRIDHIAL